MNKPDLKNDIAKQRALEDECIGTGPGDDALRAALKQQRDIEDKHIAASKNDRMKK